VNAAFDQLGSSSDEEGRPALDAGSKDDEGGLEALADPVGDIAEGVVRACIDLRDHEPGIANLLSGVDEAVGLSRDLEPRGVLVIV
jgi:hypothetical protein